MQSSNELTYDDFEVEIGQGKGLDYPITVLHSEAGETRATMHFPYDELVLENRLLALKNALLGSGGDRRTSLSPEEQAVQDFGSDLFNALITGEVRNRYDISLEKAKQNGRGLRLKLHIQSPNLAVLPWEFMYETRQEEYMGLMRSISIVRYPEHPQPIQPLTVELPLRILGMVASPKDLQPLDIDNEKQRIEEALKNLQEKGLVELTWLEGQTWRDLHKAMLGGPWHIFHFIGHGGFDPVHKEGIIALADDNGRMRSFGATELSRLLADHQSLRLVILNSCEGARGSERDLNSSNASILVRRGIPAVLAMQYKITDRAAIEFSRTFYDTLSYGLPVDTAVAEARKAISIEIANTVEWGTPVLYMRSPDGMLFNIRKKKIIGKNREDLLALYSKGIEAYEAQDWNTAINQFKNVLVIIKKPVSFAKIALIILALIAIAMIYLPQEHELTAIKISPATSSVVLGGDQKFTATTFDQFGNDMDEEVTWSSSDPAVGIIDSTGKFTAKAAGTTTIKAVSGSASGTATASVWTPTKEPTKITVSPATASLEIGRTQLFTTIVLDQFGSPIATTITWSSSNQAVGTIDSTGTFTSLATGTTTIKAASGSVSRTATVTVLPPPVTIPIRIQVVTGTDGTNDKPILKLYNKQGGVAAQFTMDKSNALRPGQTDEFTFTSSLTFCDLTGFQIIKPAGPAGDDPRDLREEYIYIDNVLVFFSRTTGTDFSPVTSTSFPPNGGWSGTNEYKTRCG
jgi:uncharacterized protein YjdB